MEKLPKEFKEKWVAALRSGEYKQGRWSISPDSGTYCCLGVASMVYSGNLSYDNLPEAIAGGQSNPIANKLMNMNDGFMCPEHSFTEIADYIEANL